MVELNFNHIYKKYPSASHYVAEDFDLDIKDKEFVVFVGPPGRGKSTILRMVVGLEDITEGELKIDSEVVSGKAPEGRDIVTVFQNYTLYPHTTVYDNMAFGLKLGKYKKDGIDERVHEAAGIPGLTESLQRESADLSGSQHQRVATGRTIVRDAKMFLMDEPLSNLNAKLRVSVHAEIARIHRRIGSTAIYVTYNQTRAMILIDCIVITSSTKDSDGSGAIGHVEQTGTPQELYNHPANKFVAGFIGSPAMNFFEATVEGDTLIDNVGFEITLPEGQKKLLETKGHSGKKAIFGIHPEDISSNPLVRNTYPGATIKARVTVSELLGVETTFYIESDDVELASRTDAHDTYESGEQIELTLDVVRGRLFDPETKATIR